MNFFTSVVIVLLVLLIQSFLQLNPGVFAIFYHSALAKHSRKKADDLSLYYFLGLEIWNVIIFLSFYFILSAFFIYLPDFMTQIFPWLLAGICFALTCAIFFWYFKPRTKNSTELFISRHTAANLTHHAESVKSRTDALLLGALSCTLEFCFTFPLYLIIAYLTFITDFTDFWFIILYIIAGLVPIFTIRSLFRTHHNLAEIQRLRVRSKSTVRLILTICFLILTLLIINLGLIQNGF